MKVVYTTNTLKVEFDGESVKDIWNQLAGSIWRRHLW